MESDVSEASRGPRLFSELGTGITTREVVMPTVEAASKEGALEAGAEEGWPHRR